jgi:hypothetical protein
VPSNYPPPYSTRYFLTPFVAEKAIELYEQMETSGPAPNLFTYNVMMRTFAEAGRTQVKPHVALSHSRDLNGFRSVH